MLRRVTIFIIAVAVGLSLAAMTRGEWPAAKLPYGVSLAGSGEAADVFSGDALRMAGLTRVVGPGVRIMVEDAIVPSDGVAVNRRLFVHSRDLLLLSNELFAAGAEAVAINGQRMVAGSAIRCVGPAIRINDVNTAPPYVVEAAGDPDVLKQAVMMMGGIVDLLSRENLRVDVQRVDRLTIPAYGESGSHKKIGGAGK